jgi:hypothetical protein
LEGRVAPRTLGHFQENSMRADLSKRVRSHYPLLLLLIGAAAVAGPINPPPGPVSPTGKTINQSEPRVLIDSLPVTITASGSYYLGADLEGTGGITIHASDVTIDMAGFSVDAGPGAGGDGIRSVGSLVNITIVNGSISGWPGDGVDLGSASNCLLEDLVSSGNSLNGFVVGAGSTMVRCTSSGNGGSGIGGSDNGRVIQSSISSNGSTGINLGDGATIESSSATGNGGAGVVVGDGASISRTTSSDNSLGFGMKDGGIIVDCAALSNRGDGFDVGAAVQIRSCNATANSSHGMRVGRSSSVLDSISGGNGVHGLLLGRGAVARGNACRDNDVNGIEVESETVGVVIEQNHVFNNKGIGIEVKGGGSLIFSNAASQNGQNYSLRGDNAFGTITDVSGDGAFNLANSYANLQY